MLRFKSVVKMLIRNDAVLCATDNSTLVPPNIFAISALDTFYL